MSHSDRCAAARGCPRTAGGWSSRRRPALVPGPQSPSACGGSRVFDPTVVGTSVLYGYWSDDCGDGRESLRRFEPSTRRREQADLAGPGVVLSVARDGGDVHWLRGNVPRRECTAPDSPCELMRSRNPVFARIKGGEDCPPLARSQGLRIAGKASESCAPPRDAKRYGGLP
jgi:hypothetical protein